MSKNVYCIGVEETCDTTGGFIGQYNTTSFVVLQNYPNPFIGWTKISYYLPEKSVVWLTVYDIGGRLVRKIGGKEKKKGWYTLRLCEKGKLPNGIYFYHIQAGIYSDTKKMMKMW